MTAWLFDLGNTRLKCAPVTADGTVGTPIWGVDVAVSTPRLMSALVEEAVSVGDLVRLLRFSHGDANLVELTLPEESALAGTQVGDVEWPQDTSLVTIIRGTRVLTPTGEDSLEAGDELLFVAAQAREEQLEDLLSVRKES